MTQIFNAQRVKNKVIGQAVQKLRVETNGRTDDWTNVQTEEHNWMYNCPANAVVTRYCHNRSADLF